MRSHVLSAVLLVAVAASAVGALLVNPAHTRRGTLTSVQHANQDMESQHGPRHSLVAALKSAAINESAAASAKQHQQKRPSFRAQSGGDGTLDVSAYSNPDGVHITHFTFPGRVDNTMYIKDDLLIALSAGDIYATATHGRTWDCWTCGSHFGGLLSGQVRAFFSQTDALSTESLERTLRAKYNDQICVTTDTKTFMISTKRRADGGLPTELLISDSAALREFPQLRAGSVRFDALEFHPLHPNHKAFGFVRDPNCDPFRGACRSFAFVTTDLKNFFLVPAFEPYLLMWENPVAARHTNFSVPFVERSRNAFDNKAYNPSDFFMVLSPDLRTPLGRLVRLPLDDVDWNTITKDALAARTSKIYENVADARAIVGHEFVGGYDPKRQQAYFAMSTDNFKTLTQLEFPKHVFSSGHTQDGPETGYTVVDEREDVFVNVYRGTRRMRQLWGHTYMSGLRGLRYTISLPYTRTAPPDSPTGTSVDFHRVRGLDGILIANKIANPSSLSCRRCGQEACASHCQVQTLISRDNGKTWQHLRTQPQLTGDVVNDDSEPLHLHGVTSGWHTPSILSSRHAPGFIMGNGNTGGTLNKDVRDVWLSRNAGRTWRKVANGPHLYGEGDLGALVFLTPKATVSGRRGAHLNYSVDGGQTFDSTPILQADDATEIDMRYVGRPVHDPLSRFAMLVGVDSHNRVHVFRVDFSGTKVRSRCTGFAEPNSADSDFETFTPQSHAGEGCLLGRRQTFLRKKMGHECWVMPSKTRTSIDYSLPVVTETCACTFDDYECDYGYEEQADGSCKNAGAPTPEQICTAASNGEQWAQLYVDGKGNYMTTKGYRRIAGDSCSGSLQSQVEPAQAWAPCPAPANTGSKGGHSWLTALLVLGFVGAIGAVLYRVNPRFRDVVDDTAAAAGPVAVSAVDRVKAMFSGPGVQRYGALPADEDGVAAEPDTVTPTHFAVSDHASGEPHPATMPAPATNAVTTTGASEEIDDDV